jgi:ElaB/YqjD/DUF883 family membrane-anchored ribosome-binding protein
MALETGNTRAGSANLDHEALSAQLAELRKDVSKLASSIGSTVSDRGHTIARDVTDGVNEAAHYMGRKGHAADVQIERAITANPYMALAMAVGAGLVLGAMSRR